MLWGAMGILSLTVGCCLATKCLNLNNKVRMGEGILGDRTLCAKYRLVELVKGSLLVDLP